MNKANVIRFIGKCAVPGAILVVAIGLASSVVMFLKIPGQSSAVMGEVQASVAAPVEKVTKLDPNPAGAAPAARSDEEIATGWSK